MTNCVFPQFLLPSIVFGFDSQITHSSFPLSRTTMDAPTFENQNYALKEMYLCGKCVCMCVHKSQFLSSNLRSNSTFLTNSKLKQFFLSHHIRDLGNVHSSPQSAKPRKASIKKWPKLVRCVMHFCGFVTNNKKWNCALLLWGKFFETFYVLQLYLFHTTKWYNRSEIKGNEREERLRDKWRRNGTFSGVCVYRKGKSIRHAFLQIEHIFRSEIPFIRLPHCSQIEHDASYINCIRSCRSEWAKGSRDLEKVTHSQFSP